MRPRPKRRRLPRYPKPSLPNPYDKSSPNYAERKRISHRFIEGKKVVTIGGQPGKDD